MRRPLHIGGVLSVVVGAAAAGGVPISNGGTGTVTLMGLCRDAAIGFVNTTVANSERMTFASPFAAAGAQTLLPTKVERRCVRKLARLCRRQCARAESMPVCAACDDVGSACHAGTQPLTCEPLPGELVTFEGTVDVAIEFQPPEPTTHQWSCEFVVRNGGTVVFSGMCAQPSKAPVLDGEYGAYLLPMGVRDAGESEGVGPGSFGDFRGYLVVDEALLDHPDAPGTARIRGVTGQLTYQVGTTWLYNVFFQAPWDLGLQGGNGAYRCVLSGRLHFGDIPEY
jgi:hypothetical protein